MVTHSFLKHRLCTRSVLLDMTPEFRIIAIFTIFGLQEIVYYYNCIRVWLSTKNDVLLSPLDGNLERKTVRHRVNDTSVTPTS